MKPKVENLSVGHIEIRKEEDGNGCIYIPWSCNLGWGEIRLAADEKGNLFADTEMMCSKDDKEFLKMVLAALAEKITVEG